jgi:hypothetical protein
MASSVVPFWMSFKHDHVRTVHEVKRLKADPKNQKLLEKLRNRYRDNEEKRQKKKADMKDNYGAGKWEADILRGNRNPGVSVPRTLRVCIILFYLKISGNLVEIDKNKIRKIKTE